MRLLSVVLFTVFLLVSSCQTGGDSKKTKAEVAVLQFDYNRDARADINKAVQYTIKSGDHILLDVGGDWCIWCHRLDSVLYQTGPISDFLEKNYVVIKINYSKENKNQAVLDSLPKIPGYPHLFVLDEKGKLLHSQGSEELEEGKGHSAEKVLKFLQDWAPKKEKNG